MPNDYENPKYTNKNEYHAGDGPFQFPWWAIVIAFVVWWPLGLVFIGLNAAMKNGRLGGFEQTAREATRDRTASGAKPVYNAEFRPIYDTPAQPQPKAAAPHAAPQQAQVRAAGKKLKGAALATGLTVAGVLLLICALAALPSAIYWLPEALTEGGSYWTWLIEDSMPMLMSLTGGIGCLFGANHIRTTRRMRKKIDNIVGDAKYMYIQDIADAIPCSYEKCCKHLENCIDEGLFGPDAYLDMRRKCLVVSERPPEPTPAPEPTPETIPEPRAVFNSDGTSTSIAAGETKTITVYIQNAGTTAMRDPILTLKSSGSLLIMGSLDYMLDDIREGRDTAVTETVKAPHKNESQMQTIDASLSFY